MSSLPPRRRTVDDVAAPYANYLVPVPAPGSGVCGVCRTAVVGYPRCYACNEARRLIGRATADITAFVSLAPRGEQLARELVAYKNGKVTAEQRRRMTFGLAAVLWKWLGAHERCVAGPSGTPRYDLITSVPSTSGRLTHPLRELVSGIVAGTGARYRDVLVVNRQDLAQRGQASDRFAADRTVRGTSVLVVDDTWTTGAHAQSASAALKAAGARYTGVVAIGRWLNPDFADNRTWLAQCRTREWNWDRCCLEAPESGRP